VKWPGHPLEPLNCQDEDIAAELSDWGWPGRAELHNEYLEYGLVMRADDSGRLRPKRFVATTELMEWWRLMAVQDPAFFLSRVAAITGLAPSFESVFGRTVAQWGQLTEAQRVSEFMRVMVGNRSTPPASRLNQDHVLFMAHQINGLDDLVYVVHFGAFAYAVMSPEGPRRATIEEIFNAEGVPYLFCRNADPAAAEGAYNQAFMAGTEAAPQTRQLAFANPLGMYMRALGIGDLFFNGQPVPEAWVRWSRGDADKRQRLEFGPLDSEPGFLDEVTIGTEHDAPRLSGYQIAKRIEVGPLVVVGAATPLAVANLRIIAASPTGTIACGTEDDDRCQDIAIFKQLFDNRNMSGRTGTRGGPVG
jgi:hypothetical protein